jgi:hypothetical protein
MLTCPALGFVRRGFDETRLASSASIHFPYGLTTKTAA